MEYNRIVAVTGMPGLYEILGSKSDGAIVRSLEDQSTKFVSSRVHNLSHLESIEIYTVRDNVNLADVFHAMQSNAVALPDVKDNKALKGYFETVFPDMDFERVYTSDLKKMVKWFEVLRKNNVEIKLTEEGEEEPAEETTKVAPVAENTEKAAPAKKKSTKKNVADTLAAADEKIVLDVAPDEVPEVAKPKRTRKKKTDES
jgi:hypothetical protein